MNPTLIELNLSLPNFAFYSIGRSCGGIFEEIEPVCCRIYMKEFNNSKEFHEHVQSSQNCIVRLLHKMYPRILCRRNKLYILHHELNLSLSD